MALFQKTVISKYLHTLNAEKLKAQWDLFCEHFHNAAIQENIRNSKEEQYQEGFLRDLFYTKFNYSMMTSEGPCVLFYVPYTGILVKCTSTSRILTLTTVTLGGEFFIAVSSY